MEQEKFSYQPGVCNIDSSGIRWRKNLGLVCLVVGILSLGTLYWFHFGMIFRFSIGAGFGFGASLNLIQAREHFCVINASRRTFETSLRRTKITDDLYKDIDLKKMRNMLAKSIMFALAGGCLGLLPL